MRRLWSVARIVLLLAVGYLAVEGGAGYATVGVLGWWVWWWGWREPMRYVFDGTNRRGFASGDPDRIPLGTVLRMNVGHPNETTWVVVKRTDRAVVVAPPGRWVR